MCKATSVDEFLKMVFEKIDEKAKMNKNELFDLFWFRGESCQFKKNFINFWCYEETIDDDLFSATNKNSEQTLFD